MDDFKSSLFSALRVIMEPFRGTNTDKFDDWYKTAWFTTSILC